MHRDIATIFRSLVDPLIIQECIPVGCVPPAAVAVWGGDGLHQAPPPEETPRDQAPPSGADPPLWTESQMPVKTLPCPNFVVGGKPDKADYSTDIHVVWIKTTNWLWMENIATNFRFYEDTRKFI